MKSPPIVFTRVAILPTFFERPPIIDARGVRLIARLDGSAKVNAAVEAGGLREGKAPSRFIQKEEDGTDVPNAGPAFPI